MTEDFLAELGLLPQATDWTVALARLVAAALLGGLVGAEREMRGKAAGLRTHMTVALGASLFSLLTFELMHLAVAAAGDEARTDPIRIIEAVTAGVAFLAAGTILTRGGDVQGLTTGAGLWVAGAIGVACGIGQLGLAIIVTALLLVVLAVLRRIERRVADSE